MITKVNEFNLEIHFVSDIESIDSKNVTLFRPRESYYSWKRLLLTKVSSQAEIYKERFSLKNFDSFNITSVIDSHGEFKGDLDLESSAVIQSSNILPDIALAKKLGFKNLAILPVPEKLFRKCLVSNKKKLIFLPNFKVMYSTMDTLFATFEDHFVRNKKNSIIIDINDPQYKDYYKFTIIRNPIDRFLSLYYWSFKREDLLPEYKHSIELITGKDYSLNVLLNVISKIPDSHSNNHWVSQNYKRLLNPVKHTYSMADISAITNDLSRYTESQVVIPHENQSKNDSTKINELKNEELDVLKVRYQEDFQLFESLNKGV